MTSHDLVNALTVIRQLFTQGNLDEPRRTLLKDLVIQRNDALLGALELYSTTFDLADLLDSIDVLLRQYSNFNLPPLAPPIAQAIALPPVAASGAQPALPSGSFGSFATFKVVIVGDGGVGKTNFTRRLLGRSFESNYVPTIGVDVLPLRLKTNKGDIVFNLWDLAGQEKFGGLRDGYYIGAHAGIVMFSVTERQSYKSLPNWHRDVIRVAESVPIVLLGTKIDLTTERHVMPKSITYHRKKNLRYVELSSKTSSREEMLRPMWWLARMLTNDQTLELLDENRQKINFEAKFDDKDDGEESEDGDDQPAADQPAPEEESSNPLYMAEACAANPLYAPAPMAAPAAFDF